MTLNQDESLGDIGGWVTIDNNSGKKYENAKLKLIAGDVNIVRPSYNRYLDEPVVEMAMDFSAKSNSAPEFS